MTESSSDILTAAVASGNQGRDIGQLLKSLGFREIARLRPSWWQRRLGVSTTLVMERRAGQD